MPPKFQPHLPNKPKQPAVPQTNQNDRFNLNALKTDVTEDIEKAIAATKAHELSKLAAFVTGGANGLGKEIVKALAKEGTRVAILDRDQSAGQALANELTPLHGKGSVMFFMCNLAETKSFEDATKQAKTQFGRFDILINNASCWMDSIENFDKAITLNFKSVVTGSLIAVNAMGAKKGGSGGMVINIADTLAFKPAYLTPIYAATKAAVIKFTSDMGVLLSDYILVSNKLLQQKELYNMSKVGFISIVPSTFSGSRLFDEPHNKIFIPGRDMLEPFNKTFGSTQASQTAEQVAQSIVGILKTGDKSGTFLVEKGNFKKAEMPEVSLKPFLPATI